MIPLALVACAFVLMLLSDILKLSRHTAAGKLFFSVGMLMLFSAGVVSALIGRNFDLPAFMQVLFLLMAAMGAWGVYTSLFTSLPTYSTYLAPREADQLVDSGMYALCRHPGALWFPVFSVFLALGLGNFDMLSSAVFASVLNIFYVWFQDKRIFPLTIKGYAHYQKTTPFLIPTAHSFSSAVIKKTKKQVDQ